MEDKKLEGLITWEFRSHANMKNGHLLLQQANYKNEKIYRETLTKYRNGKPGKGKTIFWRPFDNNNYATLEELLTVIDKEEKRNGK